MPEEREQQSNRNNANSAYSEIDSTNALLNRENKSLFHVFHHGRSNSFAK